MTLPSASWPGNIFLLIPSYQSAETLGPLLSKLTKTAPAANICVIDDASTDGTDRVCAEFGVIYVAHATNQGKGAALTTGFKRLLDHYHASWIITMDADGQHAVEDVPSFVDWASKAESDGMCIGARSKTLAKMPPARIFSNSLTSLALSLLTGRNIPDSQCGFRIYSAGLLRRITCDYPRFEMESEIILKAARLNYPISRLEVQTLYFNGPSHIAHLRDTLRWIRSVIFVWWNLRKQSKKPA